MALALLAAAPARAHYVYESDDVYDSDSYCTRVRSEVSHGSVNAGYAKVDVTSRYLASTAWGDVRCGWNKARPAGRIAAAFDWMVYRDGQWRHCAGTQWSLNKSTTHKHVIYWNFQDPMCGHGWYGTLGHGAVHSNGRWNGGSLFSGSHYL